MDDSQVDPTRCPLCAQDNKCGAEQGAGSCWCQSAPVASELLDRVPPALRDRACICAACASRQRSDEAATAVAGE